MGSWPHRSVHVNQDPGWGPPGTLGSAGLRDGSDCCPSTGAGPGFPSQAPKNGSVVPVMGKTRSFRTKGRHPRYECLYALFPCIKNKSFLSDLTWGFHDGIKHTSAFVVSFLLHTCLYPQTGRGTGHTGGLSLTLDIREGCLCVPSQEACALSLGDAWGSGGHGSSTSGLRVHRGIVQPGRAVDLARGPGGPHMSGHGGTWLPVASDGLLHGLALDETQRLRQSLGQDRGRLVTPEIEFPTYLVCWI